MCVCNKAHEVINTKSVIVLCMATSSSSSSSEVEEIQAMSVREQVSLYRQLREQLVQEVERYRREGKDRLADIISESLKE